MEKVHRVDEVLKEQQAVAAIHELLEVLFFCVGQEYARAFEKPLIQRLYFHEAVLVCVEYTKAIPPPFGGPVLCGVQDKRAQASAKLGVRNLHVKIFAELCENFSKEMSDGSADHRATAEAGCLDCASCAENFGGASTPRQAQQRAILLPDNARRFEQTEHSQRDVDSVDEHRQKVDPIQDMGEKLAETLMHDFVQPKFHIELNHEKNHDR